VYGPTAESINENEVAYLGREALEEGALGCRWGRRVDFDEGLAANWQLREEFV
jgi:hypothetical protein